MRQNRCQPTIARVWAAAALAGALGMGAAQGQTANPDGAASPGGNTDRAARHGQFAGMQHAMGEVTAVSGNTLTVKTGDGSTITVVTTDNTRFREDRGPVKVSDLHPGDGLMAIGNRDPNAPVLHAAMIFAQTAAEIKTMRENLGKTYITGRVTGVNLDEARITVERADHVAQTIGFDETTSFKRAPRGGNGNGGPGGSGSGGEGNGEPGGGASAGPDTAATPGDTAREPGSSGFGGGGMGMGGMALGGGIDRAFSTGESITLADIKVGDLIAGTGTVKNGTFVPTRLVDSPPRPHRPHPGAAGAATAGPAAQ